MPTLSKPLSYGLAIAAVLIGTAIAYQIALGGNFSLKNDSFEMTLGEIPIGNGEQQTTVGDYLNENQQTLDLAEKTIQDLQQRITSLEQQLSITQRRLTLATRSQRESTRVSSDSPGTSPSVRNPASVELATTMNDANRIKQLLRQQKSLTNDYVKQLSKPIAAKNLQVK